MPADCPPWSQHADFRKNNLDALRLALAVLVIFSHSYPLATGSALTEPLAALSNNQLSIGSLAVDGFFAISGFLIANSWQFSRSVRGFLRKRVLRIYPAYLVAALICLLVVEPLVTAAGAALFAPRRIVSFVVNASLLNTYPSLPGALADNPFPRAINGSMWTIHYEFGCYLLILVLGLLHLNRPRLLLAGFFLVVTGFTVALATGYDPPPPRFLLLTGDIGNWLRFLPAFLAGAVFHAYRERILYDGRLATVAIVVLVASPFVPVVAKPLTVMPLTYLMFFLGFNRTITVHRFGRFGDFSYGTYLYAFPIQQSLVYAFPATFTPTALSLVATPLSLLAGVISWHGVEKWALRLKPLPVKKPVLSVDEADAVAAVPRQSRVVAEVPVNGQPPRSP